ncbi:reverse transcriptase domain-containing protein [Tanacetum coccineum]|uniref:Reverse transcriptase domain-containing protein n=1 Tax=Tanacetum coccineum TaxID=301880 RepID=A0ABQ5CQ63_9ASTR
MIRVVRINVPLIDVLAGIPNYDKFLKELVSNKHKLEQISSAFLSDESSAMIQNKVPPKLGDPRSFLIPCTFNKVFSCNALADLGTSINLMLYSVYAKLSLETLKPTKMSVRLVDRSFQFPIGIANNMLVKVGKFTFLVNFIILEMEEDSKVSLILERPFLHTADAVIHVKQKQLNLRTKILMLFSMKEAQSFTPSRKLLSKKNFAEFDEFIAITIEENIESKPTKEIPFEKITFDSEYKIKKSLDELPTNLKLKPLPNHLEYVFLEEPSFLPVIISSHLSEPKQRETNDKKPVVQKQRRLNPNMQDVVKKEIVKLLNFGIIYPIADSPWVSPIHYAPKKGGITIVTNEKDELVPTRTITDWRIEESVEVFIDDFSVFGNSFDNCLHNLDKMFQRCKDANLVFNWENVISWLKKESFLATKYLEQALKLTKPKSM